MSEEKQIRFVRFKSPEEDVVGYVTFNQEYITIEKPLYVIVDTLIEEGRHILAMHEYLPQSIVMIQHVDVQNQDILFTTPVKEDFAEQYIAACDYYYSPDIKLKPSKKAKKKELFEDSFDEFSDDQEDAEDNVISIMEALIDKRNKPIH